MRNEARRRRVQLEMLESRLLLSAAFSDVDVAGTWAVEASFSHGTAILDASGNVTGGSVVDVSAGNATPSGTYTIDAAGNFTLVSDHTSIGAMNAAKDVISFSDTNKDHTLMMLVNSRGGNFSNADLNETWFVGLEGFAGDSSGFGTLVFDGNGHITSGSVTNSNGTHSISGGNYTVSADGSVDLNPTGAGGSHLVGTMNGSKDFAALNDPDLILASADGDTVLVTLVKGKGTYSNADAVGSWNVSFDGGTGSIVLDGSGHITGGTITNASDGVQGASGSYTLSSTGKFVLSITTTGADGPTKNVYTGQLNGGRNLIAINRVNASGDKLAVLVKSANHAPTLTTIAPLGTAVDLNGFNFDFATLKGHSNAADLDGDVLKFQITAIAPGTVGLLELNGNIANVGDFVQSGDTLVFMGSATTNGNVNAFSVKAWDGSALSATAVQVVIKTALQPKVRVESHEASETAPATTGKGLFTFSRSGGDMTQPLTVFYAVGGNATITGGGQLNDYSLGVAAGDSVGTITIPANTPSVTLALTPVDDLLAEGTETCVITVGAPFTTYAVQAGKNVAIVTIADNEPTVSVTATKAAASETNNGTTVGVGQFTFKRTGTSLPAMDVLYTVTGSANNGVVAGAPSDLVTPLSGTVHFDLGATTEVVNVIPVDDQIVESAETVIVTLHQDGLDGQGVAVSPTYFVDALHKTGTVTIADNEPTVNVSASPATTSEKPGSAAGKFVLTRSLGSLEAMDVTYAVGGTAGNGGATNDLVTPLTGTVHFDAGVTSVSVPVAALDDGNAESAEAVTVTLTSTGSSPYRLGTKVTAAVAIADYTVAPASIAGKVINFVIASGTGTFNTSGGYQITISDDGHYVLIGTSGAIQTSVGSYTYSRSSGAVAAFTAVDSDGGGLHGTMTFTSATQASFSFVKDDASGTQTGKATVVAAPAAGVAPVSIAGLSLGLTNVFSSAPFNSDAVQITFSQSSNHYVITGTGSDGFASTGTWSYPKFSANVGVITQHDSGAGDITTVLTFATASTGTYVITDNSGGIKRGAFAAGTVHGSAPATVAGTVFALHATGGTSPNPGSSGTFLLTFDSSTTYFTSDVGTPLTHKADGTYTYEQYSPGVGVLTITGDSLDGNGILVFGSSSATQGVYLLRFDNNGNPLFQKGGYQIAF